MANTGKTMRGFLAHDSRIVESNLRVNDGAAGNSSFTQAGSRPGSATITDSKARLVPRISHAQGASTALVKVSQAGVPGRSDKAVHGSYRLSVSTEDADDYRGWNPPVLLSEAPNPVTFGADDAQYYGVATIPSTQTPIIFYTKATNHNLRFRSFDWATGEWAAEVDVNADIGVTTLVGSARPVCCLVVPETERILAFFLMDVVTGDNAINVVYSDDAGVNFSEYATRAGTIGAPVSSATRLRCVYHLGDVGLLAQDANKDWVQVASNSLGTSFDAVETRTTIGADIDYHSLPGGKGVIITYRDNANDYARCIRLTSPFQPTSEGTVVQVDGGGNLGMAQVTSYVDWDGTIYVFGREDTVGVIDVVHCWYSTDLGDTFTEFTTATGGAVSNLFYRTGSDTYYFNPSAATPAKGWGFVFGEGIVAGGFSGDSDDIHCVAAGGWSSLSAHHGDGSSLPGDSILTTVPAGTHRRDYMFGWGFDITAFGHTWFPWEVPNHTGSPYTLTGSGHSLTATGLQVSTSSATTFWTDATWMTTAAEGASLLFEIQVDSTDSNLGNDKVSVRLRLADGTSDIDISIRFDIDAMRVYDNNAGGFIAAAAVINFTSFKQIAVYMRQRTGTTGALELWYKSPFETTWTEHLQILTLNNDTSTPAAANLIEWGHRATTSSVTRWRQFHYRAANQGATDAHWRYDTDSHLGRPLSTLPYPIPEVGTTAGEAFLRAEFGPGRRGEIYTIAPHFDYPISAIHPTSPSRIVKWRSTSTALQRIAWDLGQNTALGESYSIGLAVEGANFQSIALLGWNGAAWVTLGTLSLSHTVSSNNITVAGDLIHIPGSTGAWDRFVQAEELTGGFVVTDVGGDERARRIVANTGGAFTDHAGAHPVIRFEGHDGTESSGDGAFYRHSGILVVHLDEHTHYSRFAVQIAASQTVPDAFYSVGRIVLGGFIGLGRQWSRGWSHRLVRQVVESAHRGVTRVREQAAPVMEWSIAWMDPANLRDIRQASVEDLDHYGPTAANKAALVAAGDVLWQIQRLLRVSRSGELPVVAVAEIENTTGTSQVDPMMFLIGQVVSAAQATHVVGNEGTGEGEVYRVEPITIRGQS